MGPSTSASKRAGNTYRKTRKSTGICCKVSLNSLWSIWYCFLVVALQLYIVTRSIKTFAQYISLPWPLNDQPYLELNAYIGFLGASVVMMPFFIATAVLKVGNYPNDGRKLSSQSSASKKKDFAVYQNIQAKRKETHWAQLIWRHGGPTSAFIHIASAFCLLLPKVFIQAQLIRHGFVKKRELWVSELDFLATRKSRLVSLSFLSAVNASEILAQEDGRLSYSVSEIFNPGQETVATLSAELINFGISLLVYSLQYSSVLWESSKPFGFLFSVQLFVNGLQQILAFAGFSILYKVHICNPSIVLVRFNRLMLDATTTVLVFFLYNVAMTATSCTSYTYALQKYQEWVDRQLRRHHVLWVRERWRLWGYTPHVAAFVVLVILAAAATPLAYDLTLVYCGSLDGIVLASVTSMVLHIFFWILLWLFLTVKQRWKFDDKTISKEAKKRAKANADNKPLCNGHILNVDPELARLRESGKDTPLLVIDNAQTYQIREKSCRNVIVNLASQSLAKQTNSSSTDEEDIYWLKPGSPSPKTIDTEDEQPWSKHAKKSSQSKPHKVTFEEALVRTSPTKAKALKQHEMSRSRKARIKMDDFMEAASEEGDYATLTNMPEVEVRDRTLAYRRLCPLGGDGLNSLASSRYFDTCEQSSRCTDSDTGIVLSKAHTGPKIDDRVSICSNLAFKGPSSDTSSGIYSNSTSTQETSNNLEDLEKVEYKRNASMDQKNSTFWDISSSSTASSTFLIMRNSIVPEKGQENTSSTNQLKLTTFSETP